MLYSGSMSENYTTRDNYLASALLPHNISNSDDADFIDELLNFAHAQERCDAPAYVSADEILLEVRTMDMHAGEIVAVTGYVYDSAGECISTEGRPMKYMGPTLQDSEVRLGVYDMPGKAFYSVRLGDAALRSL